MNLSPLPIQKFFDNNGRPLVGGLLFTYVAGTSTKIATYTDDSGLSQNTNPVVLDFRGECRLWIDPTLTYKFVLSPADDTDPPTRPIWTVDNISIFGSSGASVIGKILWPLTDAEIAAGFVDADIDFVGPQGFLPRYKIVSNDVSKATQNTLAAQKLWNPLITDGPVGQFWLPNNGGGDVWYFNDLIEVRPGVSIDCGHSIIDCTKNYTATDDYRCFLMAIRDFEIKNGTLNFQIVGAPAARNIGVMRWGSRTGYGFGQWPSGIFDQTDLIDAGLPPMQNIYARNMQINCDSPGSGAIWAYGGLQNWGLEAVEFDGMGQTIHGLYYEFGYSSTDANPLDEFWISSHANNFSAKDVKGRNFNTTYGDGGVITLVGAYSATIDGLDGQGCFNVFQFRPGEALFYRPWAYNVAGVKRCMTLRNITGNASSYAMQLKGAEAATGYLNPVISILPAGQQYAAQTDLMTFSLDGFSVVGDGGINVSGPCDLNNGQISDSGTSGGLLLTDECVDFNVRNLTIINGDGPGVRANAGSNIYVPPRKKIGKFIDCVVGGNAGNATEWDNTESIDIETCRLGFNALYDGVAETTQGIGVVAGASANGIRCKGNFVSTSGGAVAYSITGSGPRGCGIFNASGTTTFTGIWEGVVIPWTATLAGTGGTINNNANENIGRYTIRDKLVSGTVYFGVSTVAAPVGTLTLGGLPITSGTGTQARTAVTLHFNTMAATTTGLSAQIGGGATSFTINTRLAGGAWTSNAADVINGTVIVASFQYMID